MPTQAFLDNITGNVPIGSETPQTNDGACSIQSKSMTKLKRSNIGKKMEKLLDRGKMRTQVLRSCSGLQSNLRSQGTETQSGLLSPQDSVQINFEIQSTSQTIAKK